MDISHSSAMRLMLLFYSSFTALPIPCHLKSLFLPLTLTPWPPFALIFLFCTSLSIFLPWELLSFAFHLLFFLRKIFIPPSFHPSACSLSSPPLFLSLSVLLGKAAFRLGFNRPRCEFWRRIDQRSFRCRSLPIGQILHPIPPERNLVLPVSLPSSFPSSRTTLAERRTLRQPKISNSIEGKFGGGAGQ